MTQDLARPATGAAGVETVSVDLGERAYPILIGPGLLASAGTLIKAWAPTRRAAIIADETVWRLHGQTLARALDQSAIDRMGR